jgi:hypothetical protein
MSPTNRLLPLTAALGLAVSGAGLAQIPDYEAPQLQARTNLLVNDEGWNLPPGSSFNSITASINDDRAVTFPVQVVTDPDDPSIMGAGIWVGGNGEGGIAFRHDAPGNEIYIGDKAAINADGDVAYYTHGGGTNYQMWLFDPTVGTPQQVVVLPLTPVSFSNVSLSDSDYIGYQGTFGGGRGFASTLALAATPDRDSVAHVYDNAIDPSSPHNYLYSPAMNNLRVIAGKVNVGVGADYTKAEIRLFNADGSNERVVADNVLDPASPFDRFDNSLAINDDNVVAASVRLTAGGVRALYRFDGGEPVEIARVGSGPILEIDFFAPAINNDGLVAFRARDAQGQAVYVGDGESLVRVIGNGDTIATDLGEGQLGQNVTSSPVFGGAPGINNNGDVIAVAGLHPAGNNQVEWGSGVIVIPAVLPDDDTIFVSGFEPEQRR